MQDTQEDQVQEQTVEVQEPQAPVDVYAGVDNSYKVVKDGIGADGYLLITIDVDGTKYDVRDPNAPDRAGVLETCARTAQQVRYNKAPKQQ